MKLLLVKFIRIWTLNSQTLLFRNLLELRVDELHETKLVSNFVYIALNFKKQLAYRNCIKIAGIMRDTAKTRLHTCPQKRPTASFTVMRSTCKQFVLAGDTSCKHGGLYEWGKISFEMYYNWYISIIFKKISPFIHTIRMTCGPPNKPLEHTAHDYETGLFEGIECTTCCLTLLPVEIRTFLFNPFSLLSYVHK